MRSFVHCAAKTVDITYLLRDKHQKVHTYGLEFCFAAVCLVLLQGRHAGLQAASMDCYNDL